MLLKARIRGQKTSAYGKCDKCGLLVTKLSLKRAVNQN